jgi:hypothetical protein
VANCAGSPAVTSKENRGANGAETVASTSALMMIDVN